MLKVKAQLLKNKQKIESSENAKRQRELKKLGKQVRNRNEPHGNNRLNYVVVLMYVN